MTNVDIYFNWSCNQLAGNPIATDKYLRDNLEVIKGVAAELLQHINYKPVPIYRGILMEKEGLNELIPHPGFTYLSFTEDLKVAEIFSNPNHIMAIAMRQRCKNLYGYITEYTPRLDEILFHHKFLSMFPYVNALLIRSNIDASTIHEQQEVTILQPKHHLKLVKHEHLCNA